MLDTLNSLDTALFRWINSHHCTALDWPMWVFSQHWFWLVVLALAFCLLTLRYEPRRWWLVALGVSLCFLIADQGSVHLFKETVCRLRPCHALEDVYMFRTKCGGQYGFVSSHAANAFALLTFVWIRYSKVSRLGVMLMLAWAMLTCYSRVYLGKHYPGDIAGGAVFGIVAGLVAWWVASFIEKKMQKNETK